MYTLFPIRKDSKLCGLDWQTCFVKLVCLKAFDTVTHIPEWLCCKTWLVNKPARAVTIRGAQWVKNIIQDSRNWYPVNFGGWLLKGGQFEPQVCVVVCRVFLKDWSGCLLIGDLNSHWYPRYWTEQANVSQ